MATGSRATTSGAPADNSPREGARRSRVVWSDVRRAVREGHGTNLVHAVKVRRDGAIDLVLKRDDLPRTKTKEPQPTTAAAQQEAKPTRKQKRMARKDDFHARKRAEAAAALGLPASRTLLPPPPPPAPLTSPSAPNPGGSGVTVGTRADKRDAALVDADKTPTKQNEETDEAPGARRGSTSGRRASARRRAASLSS